MGVHHPLPVVLPNRHPGLCQETRRAGCLIQAWVSLWGEAVWGPCRLLCWVLHNVLLLALTLPSPPPSLL